MDRYHLILHVWVKCLALTILSAIILGCVPSEGEHGRKFISEVVDAKLSLLEGQSRQLEISASGKVPSAGWTAPTLVPFEYSAPPQDGIYDFSFYATPSKESSASVITAIQVTHRLNPLPADLKGVRIHGETNDIVVMLEAPTPAPVPQIIYEIFGAKLSRVQGQADQLQIHVQGTVFSSGWSNATLIAAEYITPPADGIYDFTFYATPPSEVSKPAIAPIEVTRRLTGVPGNLTGVRIHAQTNNVTVLLDFQEPPLASAAIYEIKQVNLLLKTVPPQLSINVKGTVPSGGWTEQTLVPLEPGGSPKDGIYEFTYMATPPSGPALPVVTATELTYVVNSVPDDLLGVRVYSATNSMEAMLPRENPKPDPVLIQEVNDVQLSIVESVTRQLTITAAGMVNSTGWSSPVLAPFIYGVAPQDGIYDFSFYATPPVNSGAMVLTPINAVYVLGAIPETLKGVRIHYANNEIVVMLDKQQPPLMPAIIYAITNVQLATVSDVPDQLDIHVEGVVTSGGWTQPMLVAQQYVSAPPDGIYDFTFYATPPAFTSYSSGNADSGLGLAFKNSKKI